MRKKLALLLILTLTACGFQPVYAPSGFERTVATGQIASLSMVAVSPLPERLGQQLRNTLLDRGFTQGGGAYALDLASLKSNEFDLGVSPDNTATRRLLTVSASMVLSKDGKEILNRPLVSRATYNVLISQYATLVTQDSAERQIVDDLARQIETQTMLMLGQQK